MLVSTGIKGLDIILQNLHLGDNVVWQVDKILDYKHFAGSYIKQALKDGRNIVYIRFARHSPLIAKNNKIKEYRINAEAGFESFTKEVHAIIKKEGVGAFYVFDCLSDLLSYWATDLMISNFFMVTCPYLFKLDTIAYFAIFRGNHLFKTIARIRETTQLLLDVYDFKGSFYLQPLKVWNRYSPTMFLPHIEKMNKFIPIVNSTDAMKLFSCISKSSAESANRNLDYWDRLFISAEELIKKPKAQKEKNKMLEILSRIMLGKEERMLSLIRENLAIEDLLEIKARMVGTGFIGGKALGMLLAREILSKDKSFNWQKILEPHDSYYIGSDVFYSYIVENGWWELWLEQKSKEGYFSKAKELREKLLNGRFPREISERFLQIVEYYGQAPIIVRSSSLLEDAFGNAFAGKYESIFVVNHGTPDQRCQKFEETMRQVFASTLNDDALNYRLQRGLSQQEEQMALLVQRVSGSHYKHYYFPYISGVGFSYNTFVWHADMDVKAGMLRLVMGLGTRAVNRVEGDYPRIAALDAPLLRPYAGMEKAKKFSQHDVDILDMDKNDLQTVSVEKILKDEPGFEIGLIGVRDIEIGNSGESWILSFDKLFSATDFIKVMRKMMEILQKNYRYPVDIEFTVNFSRDSEMKINLLQCRPLQAKGETSQVKIPDNIKNEKVIFRSHGNFMGGSISQAIGRIIYINTEAYRDLIMSKKFEVARIIGRLNRISGGKRPILIGPGRWGSRDPSLGVPVSFAEINNICALVEVDDPEGGFQPELSFGSHFFLDLVETGIFYAALFLDDQEVRINNKWLKSLPNLLCELIPEAGEYEKVVLVSDFKKEIKLLSDVTAQKIVCLIG
ncbi:MAG: pyruvate water dikinase [Candidatus Saganbacteria bacterium]|uniref:Phosphoenolpyruvate synthase n=1 Tax=Candidatus Saganbacteria bacterium TaxID=2575572 RepID=A0A833L276_UNCSA|nr:MAG: pyruvate water dikinase [Candidatus Saganbacteria bacterium]